MPEPQSMRQHALAIAQKLGGRVDTGGAQNPNRIARIVGCSTDPTAADIEGLKQWRNRNAPDVPFIRIDRASGGILLLVQK